MARDGGLVLRLIRPEDLRRDHAGYAEAPYVSLFEFGNQMGRALGAALPILDRFAGHYAAFEALWRHPSLADALARLDLLEDVVRYKSRFFSSGWTHYETAMPSTIRLFPPPARQAALARDHETMAPMFIGESIEFEVMLQRLQVAGQRLKDGGLFRPE